MLFLIGKNIMERLKYLWAGDRIDARLVSQFDYSRNFFQHIISRWWIKVNDKVIKKSYKLKNNDIVEIDDLSRYLSPIILDETPDIDIPVVLEKEDYLVINKPKWVLSHPNSVRDVSQPSVVGFLYHKYKDLPTVWNFIRAGLVHRLDKDTDGLMIIAKTEKWLAYFKELFQQKSGLVSESDDVELVEKDIKFRKFYRATSEITALGDAFLEKIKDNLPYYIRENVVPKVPNCIVKMWVTKILDFKVDGDLVYLNLEILTGRTHQIRYHLSNHGLPILGDYLYGNENKEPMQLTAYRLEFIDVDGENMCLEI